MSAIQLPFAYFRTLLKDDIRVERLDRVEPFPELSEHDEISILDDLRTVCVEKLFGILILNNLIVKVSCDITHNTANPVRS